MERAYPTLPLVKVSLMFLRRPQTDPSNFVAFNVSSFSQSVHAKRLPQKQGDLSLNYHQLVIPLVRPYLEYTLKPCSKGRRNNLSKAINARYGPL